MKIDIKLSMAKTINIIINHLAIVRAKPAIARVTVNIPIIRAKTKKINTNHINESVISSLQASSASY
jgi:hypothetical protein